jgi:hypothetical protein
MSKAGEPLAKSGSFKTESGFKGVEEMIPVGEKHSYSHGVTWGIVSNDNPLRIKTAMCPYISELAGDTSTFEGRCTWSDADGDKIHHMVRQVFSDRSRQWSARVNSPALSNGTIGCELAEVTAHVCGHLA